MSGNILARETL
jgi:hypothetical protein